MILIPPVSYQGNKTKIAQQIVDIIYINNNTLYYDICCGSGAISLELINRGVHPENICMIDIGPWGIFWYEIGTGTFPLTQFKTYINTIPTNMYHVKDYILQLLSEPINEYTTCKFLLAQACNFAGKAVRIERNIWKNISIKPVWEPSQYSTRKEKSYTFTIQPHHLYTRVEHIYNTCFGIYAIHENCVDIFPPPTSVVYIDPVYKNTYKYGTYSFNVIEYIQHLHACYVSEQTPLYVDGYTTISHKLTYTSLTSSINAKHKNSKNREEYLTHLSKI